MRSAARVPDITRDQFFDGSGGDFSNDEQALRLLAAALVEWRSLLDDMPEDLGGVMREVLMSHEGDLRLRYFQYIESDQEISSILSLDAGRQEFFGRFIDWVDTLLSQLSRPNKEILLAQIELGAMMARIGYPPQGISGALRKFKAWFIKTLADTSMPRQQVLKAISVFVALVDLSLELRSYGYQRSASNDSRSIENYRLYSLSQNLAMERERQRALLMEWNHQLLSAFFQQAPALDLPRLWASEFGLWLKHKALILFEADSQLDGVRHGADRIDRVLIPALERLNVGGREQIVGMLKKMDREIALIKSTLGNLFEMHLEIENGRDPLTKLLNRRFLPVVMKKEFQLLKSGHSSGLSVLLIDIDHFKKINDAHGHHAGDVALQAVSNLISSSIRASDFAFRFGGEELLILMVDCDQSVAQMVAQEICSKVQRTPVELASGDLLRLSVSVGVACYEGDFDYMRLIERADAAMYAAKANGRNQVHYQAAG